MGFRLRILHAAGIHADGLDHHRGFGLVVVHVPLDPGDIHSHILAQCHLAEGGIFPVQMIRRGDHNEELASGGVGGHGAGHGEDAGGVGDVILREAVGGKFTVDFIAGAASAVALGAAALDHEAGDHPVESQAVIEALVGQGDEVMDGVGRFVREQFGGHSPPVLHGDECNWISHSQIPFSAIINLRTCIHRGMPDRRGILPCRAVKGPDSVHHL